MRIQMDKAKLREILRTNKEKHIKIFEEAKVDYKTKATKFLKEQAERLEKGEQLAYHDFRLPLNHSHHYDTAIRMLESSNENTIELDMNSFSKLAEDNWEWSREFLGSSNSLKG